MTKKCLLLAIRKADLSLAEIVSCGQDDCDNFLLSENDGDEFTYAFLLRLPVETADAEAEYIARQYGVEFRILPLA